MTAGVQRALIVGAGIAGPVLGMFLRSAGVEATVYEGRPGPRDEAGAFLNLAPNARAVLDAVGIGGVVDAAGTPTTSIEFVNHQGKRLGRNPGELLLIKRGALNRVLREQAIEHGVTVEFAKRLVALSEDGGQVTARFADGSEATGDVLVGCDGVHSVTRQAILPDGPAPAYTGLVGTGGFVQLPDGPEPSAVMEMTFGLRAFFGYQVTPSGEIFWFQNAPEPTEPQDTDGGDDESWKARLVELHRDDHEPIPTMLQATDGGIGRFPIYDLATLPTWHMGRIALAGDAAHVMGPHTGQGSAMALEDAMVLAMCLRDIPTLDAALATYEHARRRRVEQVVKLTRRVGNTKTPGRLGRAVRDRILPLVLPLGIKQTAKVYAHRIDWDQTMAPAQRPGPATREARTETLAEQQQHDL